MQTAKDVLRPMLLRRREIVASKADILRVIEQRSKTPAAAAAPSLGRVLAPIIAARLDLQEVAR